MNAIKTFEQTGQDIEQSMIEHERWTNAILQALHELRYASASGLDRHGCLMKDVVRDNDGALVAFVSPRASSVFPPPAPSAG